MTMMSLVKYVRESDLASIEKPVLVVYSPNDRVVNAEEVERRFAQFGSGLKELKPIAQSRYPENHVLAGDILAPGNTRNVEKIIVDFVSKLQ
jgi:esterase/lipase